MSDKISVFYSWQTDLPDDACQRLIRSALGEAKLRIEEDTRELTIEVDEATRSTPGSPNIAQTIFNKIKKSDIFVCDLTKVAQQAGERGEVRKYCNPNVAIELGYAVAALGWERIILVFNEAYGVIPDDLPFDARGHRASKYSFKPEFDEAGKLTVASKANASNAKGVLRSQLIEAINTIVIANPKRPKELEEKSDAEIKRDHDIRQLSGLFNYIHLGMMDRFIDRLSDGRITYVGQDFYEGITHYASRSSFHFYDNTLKQHIDNFIAAWTKAMTYAHQMDGNNTTKEAYFPMPGDIPRTSQEGGFFSFTYQQAQPLRNALDALLSHVRNHYLEIDLNTTGTENLQRYNEYERQTEVASKRPR